MKIDVRNKISITAVRDANVLYERKTRQKQAD